MTELQRTERWMKWVVFFVITLALSALASAGTPPSRFASHNKAICHVSLLGFAEENAKLREEFERATGSRMARLAGFVDFYENDPTALKRCLEGGYDTVIVTAHSALIAPGQISLVYFTDVPGYQGKAINYLSDRLFAVTTPSPRLKRIMVTTCNGELLRANYPHLYALEQTNWLEIETAPSDLSEVGPGGVVQLRSYRAAGEYLYRSFLLTFQQ